MVWNDAAVPSPETTYVFGSMAVDDMSRFVYHQPTQRFIISSQTSGVLPYMNTLMPGQVTGAFATSMKLDLSAFDWLTVISSNLMVASMSVLPNGDT
jgi:hypothetical protein